MDTLTGADHGYIMQNNGGVQRPAIVAWLRYWIYNDTVARHFLRRRLRALYRALGDSTAQELEIVRKSGDFL
jgi:hypothetical protein